MMKQTWLEQRTRLQLVARSLDLPPAGKRGSLKHALTFAEMLTLSCNEASARRLMLDYPSEALSFLNVLSDMSNVIETAALSPSSSGMQTPFHEIADLAVEVLYELREEAPHYF